MMEEGAGRRGQGAGETSGASESPDLLPPAPCALRPRIAVLTPLPPTKTGVAHYASILLPELAKRAEVTAFASGENYRPEDFDQVFYQLGNNPHHEWIYREAMRVPGVAVLHDLVLHHLIVEMTLARGDAEAYAEALAASHGEAGRAWAWGRAAGLHSEMGNFLLPASVDVANRSNAVIVHNQWAADRLRSFGVETPIRVVPHPYVPETRTFNRDALRAQHGIDRDARVIGFFGFLTSAKRAEAVLEAFRLARERDPRLVLLVVGEPAPNIDSSNLAIDGVVTTGYVEDDAFPAYYAAADRFVNLRYPSAGETSGTLIRAFNAGKPVAVSNYAQFAELPDDCAYKVPLGEGEMEALVEFFLREFGDVEGAQRRWLEKNARVELTVEGYLGVVRASRARSGGRERARDARTTPLFPNLTAAAHREHDRVVITLRNDGEGTLLTRTYGQPVYRLIAKLFNADKLTHDQWLDLPCDLRPGASTTINFRATGDILRLYHAIQDIPMLEPEAFAEVQFV